MPDIWKDAMASLTGDAGAQARLGTVAKNATSAVNAAKSLIGDGRPASSAVVAAPADSGASGLMPSGFSVAQIGVGLAASVAVLWLALRRR